jgi:asparagine N-glycosylation enzyme membrane subunit Stt3
MEIRLNKITITIAVIVAIYILVSLYMPVGSNCGQMQSAGWVNNFDLWLYAGALTIFIILLVLRLKKTISNREFLLPILVIIVFLFFMNTFYFNSANIAACSGTVLSDNWWEALNWIKNNTDECAVVATYWDPGHFITGIAKRSVVFDGATQGATRSVPATENRTGTYIDKRENGINHIMIYENGNVTTARIQDIATTLFTPNETLAVEILENYRKPGCNEMYYIASSDLIGKSVWWTYFSTWNPLNAPNFGQRYNYAILNLESAKPMLEQNAVAYFYRLDQNSAFVLYERNETINAFLQQQGQLIGVGKLAYFDRTGVWKMSVNPNSGVPGLLWLDPSRQALLYIPPELENSLFTRMFLFNGAGLEKFEFINSWGGEVKLFKVRFD